MKTHHIKDLLKKELLILELPEGTSDFIVMNTGYRIAVCAFDDVDFCLGVKGISTEYTLLGKPSEIKEEDARELVEQSIHTGLFAHYVKDIPVNTYCYENATESLLSAIESVIFWDVNPVNHPKDYSLAHQSLNWYTGQEKKFLESEQKTFDRNRSIILVKNK